MKTINEQIQRLRDILHTCYESIASKGGTLPPVGERNMTNLPDAVESVPQVISAQLEELTITQNGEYLPNEGVAGFSKVTAEFDTSSLPKIKVSSINIDDDCIDSEGVWDGRSIDMSSVTSLATFGMAVNNIKTALIADWDISNVTNIERVFFNSPNLKNIDVSKWNVSAVRLTGSAFDRCTSLEYLDVSKWKTDNFQSLYTLFRNSAIKIIDFRGWNVPNVTSTTGFIQMPKCESIIGGENIDSVLANNTKCLNGIKVSFQAQNTKLDRASLRALINGLADLTGQTSQTLTLRATLLAKLTEEDIAIATNKNWTIV